MSLLRKLVCNSKTSKEQSNVECAVCQDEVREPCTVPCGNNHVFCLPCLKGIVTHGHHRLYFPCPMCRVHVFIPFGGVSMFLNKKGARAKFLHRLGRLKGGRKVQRQGSLSSVSTAADSARRMFLDLQQEFDWLHEVSVQEWDDYLDDPELFSQRQRRGRDSLDSDLLSPTSPEMLRAGPDLDDVFRFEDVDAAEIQAQAQLLEQFRIQRELERARETDLGRNGAAMSEGNRAVRADENQDTNPAVAATQSSSANSQDREILGAEQSTLMRALEGRGETAAGICLTLDRDKSENLTKDRLLSLHRLQPLFGDADDSRGRGAKLGPDELDMAAVLELIQEMEENDRREREVAAASLLAAVETDHGPIASREPVAALCLMSPETMLSVAPTLFPKDLKECRTGETMTLTTSVIGKAVESLTDEDKSATRTVTTNSTEDRVETPDKCSEMSTARIALAADTEEPASVVTYQGDWKIESPCLPSQMAQESPVHSPSPSSPSPHAASTLPNYTVSSSSSWALPSSSSTAPPVSTSHPSPHPQAQRPPPPPIPPRPSGVGPSSARAHLPTSSQSRKALPFSRPAAGSSQPEPPTSEYFCCWLPGVPPSHFPSPAALSKPAPRVAGEARPSSQIPASTQHQTVPAASAATHKTSRTARSTAGSRHGSATAPAAPQSLKAAGQTPEKFPIAPWSLSARPESRLEGPLGASLGTYV